MTVGFKTYFLYNLLLHLLVILVHGASNATSDTVKILLSDAGDLASLGAGLLDNPHLLESLKDAADKAGVGLAEVLSAGSTPVGASIPLLEGANASAGAKVDLAGDGGGPDVVPVISIGAELLEDGGLDSIGPVGELKLV